MKKGIKTVCFLWMLVLQMQVISFAAEETAETKSNGILQVVVMYEDKEGKQHPIQGGSGFLIGSKEKEAEYLITSKEVTCVEDKINTQVMKVYNEEEMIDYSVKAVVKRDVMLDMTLVAQSDEMGFSIWKLSQPLQDRSPYVLCDDSTVCAAGKKVVTVGFPTAPTLTGKNVYYAKEEAITQEGSLLGDDRQANIKYLYHNIKPEPGMVGGPMLNEEGNVIALNQSKEAQEGYYALQMSELLPVLEALGIPFVTTSMLEEQRQADMTEVLPIKLILTIVISTAAIGMIAFLIVWQLTKAKREARKKKKIEELTVTQPAPVFTERAVHKEDYRQLIMKNASQGLDAETGEHSAGETMVFKQENKTYPYLRRLRTGEKIVIVRNEFVLGKEPSQTDYCITGNSAISRMHAIILQKGAGYAISDKNATNGTFVNGIKVVPFQKMEVKDGDMIRLADEDFEFRLF